MIFSDYLRSRSSRSSSNDTILDDGIIELVAEDIAVPEKMVALPVESVAVEPRSYSNYDSYKKACAHAGVQTVKYQDWLDEVRYNGVRTTGSDTE